MSKLDALLAQEEFTPEPPSAADTPLAGPDLFSREEYSWARDIFWVYENLGKKVTKVAAGSSRYVLWQHANRDKHGFITQMMPKAMALMEKARERQGDDITIIQQERREIAELQAVLRDAIKEAEKT
jgi:hypothetical protein